MKQYEVTFIVDPVLSGDEIKATAQTYVDLFTSGGCKIVHNDEMGLRQLAYPIKRRTSGIYYCVEFQAPSGAVINDFELAFRRDERILRFLSVKLDKFGVKYNDDKRNGLIGKKKDNAKKENSKKDEPKKTPVKPSALKTQSKTSLAKATVTEVAGEEEE